MNDLDVNPPTHRSALVHVESLPPQHSSRMAIADLFDPSSDLVSDGPHRLGLQDLNSFGPPSLSPQNSNPDGPSPPVGPYQLGLSCESVKGLTQGLPPLDPVDFSKEAQPLAEDVNEKTISNCETVSKIKKIDEDSVPTRIWERSNARSTRNKSKGRGYVPSSKQ